MILVEDVYKRFKTVHGPGRWVLQGVSFTIPPKVSVGLIGANGSGKSTLLRLIAGVDYPSRGIITRKCRVSWPMGMTAGLVPTLTGRQNATFVCRINGLEADLADRIAYIEDFAEIGEAFDEPIKTYSNGMRSRLQFALSLAIDFDVYISDEVTAAGDTSFRKKSAAAFADLIGRSSIVMVSHGEGTLKEFCQAGILIDQGQAFWFDKIEDALREYKSRRSGELVSSLMSDHVPHHGVDIIAKGLGEQLDGLLAKPDAERGQEVLERIESIKRARDALSILMSGMNGAPSKVNHQDGNRIKEEAKKMGMLLVGPWQIAELGYYILPGATPALIKWFPAPHNKYISLYDLNSQCVKADSNP